MSKRVDEAVKLLETLRGRLRGPDLHTLTAALEWLRPSEEEATLTRAEVFERDSWTCAYCGAVITLDTGEVDHVLPRSRGGTNGASNLAAACMPCNRSKKDRTPGEWRGRQGVAI